MFFKRNKRRNAARNSTDAACASVETLNPKVLLAAATGDIDIDMDGNTANNGGTTANFVAVPADVSMKDDGTLFINGNGNDNEVIVSQDVQNGVEVIQVYNLAVSGDEVSVDNSFSVPKADVVSIHFLGKTGNDTFENRTDLPSRAEGGADDDTLKGGSGNDTLLGGPGSDLLEGDAWSPDPTDLLWGGDDVLDGGSDDDTLRGGNGNDKLVGGFGSDTLEGNNGDDTMYGDLDPGGIFGAWGSFVNLFGEGDTMRGGLGDDAMYGQGGDDAMHGDGGSDTMFGHGGRDIMYGDKATDTVLAGDDYMNGGSGNDELYGRRQHDTLVGGSGTDLLKGGRGNDFLDGGTGLDTLEGEAGDDVLDGGKDNSPDNLKGGTGADVFVRHYSLFGSNVFDLWEDFDELDTFWIQFSL